MLNYLWICFSGWFKCKQYLKFTMHWLLHSNSYLQWEYGFFEGLFEGSFAVMQATSYHKFQLISPTMTRQNTYKIDFVISNMLILLSLGSLLKKHIRTKKLDHWLVTCSPFNLIILNIKKAKYCSAQISWVPNNHLNCWTPRILCTFAFIYAFFLAVVLKMSRLLLYIW